MEFKPERRTLPRVRELKLTWVASLVASLACRTLPRVRELKLNRLQREDGQFCRTLPRVRELKRLPLAQRYLYSRRTLPRVRELKPFQLTRPQKKVPVAPFPGCVN